MSNISKRRKEGSKAKIKSIGDHKEFLKRITKTLYYGELPTLPCLSLPVTEISCEVWSASQRGRSLRRLHADAAAGLARGACVSPCALLLALLYLERLHACNPDYLAATAPHDLFLVSLMVGNKFLQDDGEDDEVICSEWAASGGVALDELKKMELEFLNAIDWNIFVSEKSFEKALRWLERHVALRQARLRGFFTYADLAAAGGGAGALAADALADLTRAAGLALAALASALALLASALLLARLARNAPAPARAPAPATGNATMDLSAINPAVFLPEMPAMPEMDSATDKLTCCTKWTTYRESMDADRPRRDGDMPRGPIAETWWSKTSVLNWLYRSSLVNPMQRWLEKIDEYASLARRGMGAGAGGGGGGGCGAGGHCTRQRLNLSKLNAAAVSAWDR